LHEILLGAAERAGVQVVLGVTVTQIQEDKERVDVQFLNGQRDSFGLLAGFDGIRSTTRLYLVGTSFAPRHSGYGAWRVQAPQPEYVRGMEFLQGIGSKTGAMPLSHDIMYLFHIRLKAPDADFAGQGPCPLVERAIGTVWQLRRGNCRIAQ
jgi:2-polyprenyl-6-methoxyphenol hydroxylase-like FAD-dependent oxidoreductase